MNSNFKYALFISALSIIWKLVLFITEWQYEAIGKYYLLAYFLFILLGVLFGIRSFVLKAEASTLKETIKVGLKITTINALLFSAFIYVYYKWIDLAFFKIKINEGLDLLQKRNGTPEEIENYISTTNMLFTPSNLFSVTLLGFIIIGGIYSLICAPIIKKGWIK